MNPWPFILAAYGISLGAVLLLVGSSLIAMRRAEAQADNLSRRP